MNGGTKTYTGKRWSNAAEFERSMIIAQLAHPAAICRLPAKPLA